MDESLERKNPKNPMLLCPVIRCVFEFLDIEDIKNCRLVSREWGSTGKLALGIRAIIHLHKHKKRIPARRPDDFLSCFLDSSPVFSAFKISGFFSNGKSESKHWTAEELTQFFECHQKYIKELTLKFKYSDKKQFKTIDLSNWISKSPMVKKDAKYVTKLSIIGVGKMLEIPSLNLIAHIKDLKLSNCRVNLEDGIQICPIRLEFANTLFFQDGIKLKKVKINDFVDLHIVADVSLDCGGSHIVVEKDNTKYVLDLSGNNTLFSLYLQGCEIVNGETSRWVIEQFEISYISYSLNRQMQIKELRLSEAGNIDLFTLPCSIQKLELCDFGNGTTVNCSQPIVLENLEYLHIAHGEGGTDYSFLSYFMYCPRLTFLKFDFCTEMEMKSCWMPKALKTLAIQETSVKWVNDSYLNLEKLVLFDCFLTDSAKEICKAKIRVEDVFVCCFETTKDKYLALVEFLDFRKRFSFGKRFYIGELNWDEMEFKDSGMNEHVAVKSSFYIFEDDQNGRAFSEEDFHELTLSFW